MGQPDVVRPGEPHLHRELHPERQGVDDPRQGVEGFRFTGTFLTGDELAERCEYVHPFIEYKGRILTADRFAQRYGRFEARLKIPKGQGIWPAFWMLGADLPTNAWPSAGEIDVMENVGFEPHRVHGTVHGPGYSGGEGLTSTWQHPQGWSIADDFHTFAVDWAPGSITWSVDGQVYHQVTPASTGGDLWVFDKPFFLILNVAVGGAWPGYPDGSWPPPEGMSCQISMPRRSAS